jgi:hypothetical protein
MSVLRPPPDTDHSYPSSFSSFPFLLLPSPFPFHPHPTPQVAWHDVHHAMPAYNMGQYSVFWDRIFGTYRPHDCYDSVSGARISKDGKEGKGSRAGGEAGSSSSVSEGTKGTTSRRR